ncbi:MAG TPA: metalloregulator ArsR/SmtB family transcription factor [Solirubrobacteraceae bacterium]|nr:metalloregulator ArsR/SmtB family transcription factor [Solirubrobacteraceae bacterium]
MVQYLRLDRTLAALADPTRRGILERLGTGSATISELAGPFGISLTGTKKHVRVLEDAELVTTEKVGRARRCSLGPRRLEDVAAWMEGYRRMLDERLDRFGELLERTKGVPQMTSDQQHARRATVTTPADREIRIEREFDAPRDRVFAVFTDPDLVPQWWGPRDTTVVVDRMDVRPGGGWRFVVANPDGSETAFRGTYREVVAPERIVQTFEWEGMPGHVSVETATFEDLGDRTKVTTVSLFHTTEERDGMLASGMERGLHETYARLDELLARLAAG